MCIIIFSELGLNFQCWVDGFNMAQPALLDLCGQHMANQMTKSIDAFIFMVKTLNDAAKNPPFK